MTTRSITRPVTSPIARAVTGAYGGSRAFDPASLFGAGDAGFLDADLDFAALFQDAVGTTPVTAAGQPVGLRLDTSKGLTRGSELVPDASFDNSAAWPTKSPGVTVAAGVCAFSVVNGGGGVVAPAVSPMRVGRTYEIIVVVSDYTSGSVCPNIGGYTWAGISSAGTHRLIRQVTGSDVATASLIARSIATMTIESFSIRELAGNHAFQATASAKPFVRDTPRRIDYDADDSLVVTFPAALGSACTVARSIPGVGAQILTAQTIGTSYTLNVDSCADIIINRALTVPETANLTRFLNQRAGV